METCELCLQIITNPICVSCYLKHAENWLKDFGLTKKEIASNLEEIKAKIKRSRNSKKSNQTNHIFFEE